MNKQELYEFRRLEKVRPGRYLCPVCNGSMAVIDAKTKKERKCVLCKGKGHYVTGE